MAPDMSDGELMIDCPMADELIDELCRPPSSPLSAPTRWWSQNDLTWLQYLYDQTPGRWRAIAAQMPGRSEDSVRNAFHRFLSKRGCSPRAGASVVARHSWTCDDDARLRDAISRCIGTDGRVRWSSVARRLGGRRTARAARGRAERLRQMD